MSSERFLHCSLDAYVFIIWSYFYYKLLLFFFLSATTLINWTKNKHFKHLMSIRFFLDLLYFTIYRNYYKVGVLTNNYNPLHPTGDFGHSNAYRLLRDKDASGNERNLWTLSSGRFRLNVINFQTPSVRCIVRSDCVTCSLKVTP